ncbi:hypothetical protein PHLCEN_2v10529 [Hermanssonia centrifuga]|uniref:Uncharacterized protein n=1 Tax=Hermanssonia centrifuga TaxID=98765 RepID=A0A2R6NMN4_9APHY|nr:hypothetical protein PHLCEN_2v10529 [Hermanssonia centrifuga]
MPQYYVQSSTPSYHTRSRSQSHSGYPQPVVYSSSGGHHISSRDYAYGDSGKRRRNSSVGRGGQYVYPSGYSSSGHHGGHSRAPVYVTTGSSSNRRSHSSSRHAPQYVDARRTSTSGYHRRPSVSQSDGGRYHSGYHHDSEPIGDRVRRWFGLAPPHHDHYSSRGNSSRGTQYVDARTGRPVDARGRAMYRV